MTRASAADVFGDVRGRVAYHEDILAPTSEEWPGDDTHALLGGSREIRSRFLRFRGIHR